MTTSYGQTLLKRYLEMMFDAPAIENDRPVWLHGLELDLHWPEINFAVEFQGDQHFLPAFGFNSYARQRANDRDKKRLCAERGTILLRVEAIDLEYTRLFRLLKKHLGHIGGLRNFVARKQIRRRLRELNKQAIEYRLKLSQNYGSPTARRKGRTRKAARREWLEQNGYAHWLPKPPSTTSPHPAR